MQFYKPDEYQVSCENLYRKYELQIVALLPGANSQLNPKSKFLKLKFVFLDIILDRFNIFLDIFLYLDIFLDIFIDILPFLFIFLILMLPEIFQFFN